MGIFLSRSKNLTTTGIIIIVGCVSLFRYSTGKITKFYLVEYSSLWNMQHLKLAYNGNIKIHCRASKHQGPRLFKCEECHHTFATSGALAHHKLHHEEPRWKCSECDNVFRLKSALQDHLSAHGRERRHQCVCGKSYIYSQGLSNHKVKCKKAKETRK